jgi:hypothetical protein
VITQRAHMQQRPPSETTSLRFCMCGLVVLVLLSVVCCACVSISISNRELSIIESGIESRVLSPECGPVGERAAKGRGGGAALVIPAVGGRSGQLAAGIWLGLLGFVVFIPLNSQLCRWWLVAAGGH